MHIPAARPSFTEDEIEYITGEIRQILRSGRLILGPFTRQLEEEFARYCGVKYAVAVSSCTAALEIVMRYYRISGKEVIVPCNTFVATCNAVIYAGGIPVLINIDPETLCIDYRDMKKKVTGLTAGVIAVHIAGYPCPDIEEIRQYCLERNLFLIEDVAHAHGAMINGKKAGSLGDAGCFSFYPTKVMTTGTGGMITTDNAGLAEYAISLRHHGVGEGLHQIINFGNDWLMDELRAVLGISQLRALESNLARRNMIAQTYGRLLQGVEDIRLFRVSPSIRHSYYKFPVVLNTKVDKYLLVKLMKDVYGIEIGSIYDPPCHLQPVYQDRFGYRPGAFPVAEDVLRRTICLPIYVQMTDSEITYVAESLQSSLERITGKSNRSPVP